MADKTLITLTSPEGATLNTAGKYCDKDIEIVPNLQEKVATESGIVTADDGYVAMKSVDTTGVFEAGKKVFWDAYQQKGARKNFSNAFRDVGWDDNSYDPQYPLNGTSYTNSFYGSLITDTKVDIYFPGTSTGYVFGQCKKLVTIRKLIVEEKTSFVGAFDGCDSLENIVIEGTIGAEGYNFSWSPLTHDSLMSIINALKDYSEDTSGTDWLVTLGSENIAKLTEDELYIAESKGWRIA